MMRIGPMSKRLETPSRRTLYSRPPRLRGWSGYRHSVMTPNASYQDNVERLLAELDGVADRSARFRTVMVLAFPDGRSIIADATMDGHIVHEPRGSFGFGYDPVFAVGSRTLSEIGPGEKNEMSHRGRALRALADKVFAA